MKRFSILAIALCAIGGSAFGQQALFGGQMPLSPEFMQTRPLHSAAWHQGLKKYR